MEFYNQVRLLQEQWAKGDLSSYEFAEAVTNLLKGETNA